MNTFLWVALGCIVALVAIGSFVAVQNNTEQPEVRFTDSQPTGAVSSPQVSRVPSPSPTASISQRTIKKELYYPLTNYAARITNRGYGKAVTPSDSASFPCGGNFSGVHTGDDLEVTTDELSAEVPVYAVATGTVRQVGTVGGYGGLAIIEHVLAGQTVTAYYGHIALPKTTIKVGDVVSPGQQLSVLGTACSAQTAGERKHLHFAIHSGTAIDVKGYVVNQTLVRNWLNPKETLSTLKAAEPF